jgi:hypothetical protein
MRDGWNENCENENGKARYKMIGRRVPIPFDQRMTD